MSKVINLAIGIPSYGGMLSNFHARQWLEFGSTLGGSAERFRLVAFMTADINPVDRARNWLLANAMTAGADWLLMVDADTWVQSWASLDGTSEDAGFQLLRMISEADRVGTTIVTAAVVKRCLEFEEQIAELAIYKIDPASDSISKHAPMPFTVLASLSRHLEPIDACGAACMAVHLPRVVEADANFKFTGALSEDLEFCRQIREHFTTGPKPISLDPRVRTGHMSRSFPLYNR